MKRDIRSYDISDISTIMEHYQQPRFRTQQLISWIYQKGAASYSDMTNLPHSLIDALAQDYPLAPLAIIDKQISYDGTRKYVFEYYDGTRVEAVGIPSSESKRDGTPQHLTVCFSTQAGCAMACAFCATGTEGLSRNLSSGEMVSQIVAVQQDFNARITNVVSMGQGEPFQNYHSVLDALRYLNNPKGLAIGARHITLSTCGIISGIEKLSHEPEQFTLAVSLHAARQSLRDQLMPRCASQTLTQLKSALMSYVAHTGRRVSFEYLLIQGVNDSPEDLQALQEFCEGILCHVNLIPFNAVDESPYQPSPQNTQQHWVRTLKHTGIESTVRQSRGSDIDGACGQLKNKLCPKQSV